MALLNFSCNRAHEGAFLVYLNGIETPVQRVSYAAQVGQLPQVNISLFPDSEISRLGAEDRVEVQIFYKDDFFSVTEGKNPDFRLLFEGDVKGWNYSVSAASRNIGLTCEHSTSILNDLRLHFLTGVDSMIKSAQGARMPGAQSVTPELLFPWSLLFHGLAPLKQYKGEAIKRPWEIIENFFKGCNSTGGAQDLGSVVTSSFYNRYFMRHRTQFHFVPSPILEFDLVEKNEYKIFPMLQAVRSTYIVDAMSARLQELGLGASVLQTFNSLFQSMYYELATIPAPPIAEVRYGPNIKYPGEILGPANPEAVMETQNFLIHHVTKPQWLFGIAPACNVIFPGMIQSLQFEENYAGQPTRCVVTKSNYIQSGQGANQTVTDILTPKAGYPPQMDQELNERISANAGISGRNFLVWPEEYYRGPLAAEEMYPRWFQLLTDIVKGSMKPEQLLAQQALDNIAMATKRIWSTAYSQACNEFNTSVTYTSPEEEAKAKSTAQQKILIELEKKLFDEFNKGDSVIAELKKTKVLTEDVSSIADLKKALEDRTKDITVQIDDPLKAYARYEYQRLRSSARRGTVYTAFNPYVVPGFPAIIFNNEEDSNHFVGYVTSVQHTLNASNPPEMSTSVSFVHGQTLDELVQEIYDARIGNNPENRSYGDLSSAPPNALAVLTENLQVQSKAEDYFTQLFHLGASYPKLTTKKSAFDISQVIRFLVPGIKAPVFYSFNAIFEDDLTKQEIDARKAEEAALMAKKEEELDKIRLQLKMDLTTEHPPSPGDPVTDATRKEFLQSVDERLEDQMRIETAIKDEEYNVLLAQKRYQRGKAKNPPNKILDNYTKIYPTEDFAAIFQSYELAMQYVSRPVCTLDEFIKFRKGWGTSQGYVAPNDQVQGKGAPYWVKILNLKQGPGTAPTLDANNQPVNPLPKDMPDTRTDWETRLLNYRKRVLYAKIPGKSGE